MGADLAITFPKRTLRTGGLAAGRSRHARFLKGRFGYSTPARNGTCSRSAIRTTKRFIAAFRRGAAVKFCAAFSWTSPTNCANAACSTKKNASIDATFVMAKGGGAEVGPTKRGKGMKIMAIVDRHGLPLSVSTHAANHHEVRLVQLCFDFYMIEAKPENLIGDRAYDSDPLDHALRQDGIEMIAPHRSNRTKPPTQDRRRLRRFLRRWLVERFFAWIQWQRRILVRWEYHPENFLGFVQLACLVVLFRRF